MIKDFVKTAGSVVFIFVDLIANILRSLLALLLVFVTFLPVSAFMGIRYCCRRHRHPEQFSQAAQAAAARTRYRARSRKKKPKLMTLDQVNEKFPTMTFKQAKTEQPASPASSIVEQGDDGVLSGTVHDKDATAPEISGDKTHSDNQTDHANENDTTLHHEIQQPQQEQEPSSSTRVFEKSPDVESQIHSIDEEDDEDEDVLEGVDSDDTCAVCIETMEDEETVRMLKCGHIFHAECIDPWLTVRRACCPLCKADYYIPRPHNEQQDQQQENENGIELARRTTNSRQDETNASRRRRAAAIYNIWGRRHGENDESSTNNSNQQSSNSNDDSISNRIRGRLGNLQGRLRSIPQAHHRESSNREHTLPNTGTAQSTTMTVV